ncbi:MAG: hypothetical protein ABIR30_11225 [Chitinophagaceae bacterium]
MRKRPHARKVSIYLSLDGDSIQKYFNPNDPGPLYCRQLSNNFQEYLNSSVATAGRHTLINYKVFCGEQTGMRFLIEPLLKTIRRHYTIKKNLMEAQFSRFKRKNLFLLCISFLIVMICQGLLPRLFNQEHRVHSMLSNALDVFSWVILWKPIERLIFYWNPFLKDILLYTKMANAEAILVDNEEELINHHLGHSDAA